MRELMDVVESDVKAEYQKNNGVVDEEAVSKSLLEKLKGKNTKHLQLNGGSLPQVSGRAKRFARFPTLADVRRKFVLGIQDTMVNTSENATYQVVEKPIDISQIQRMVQKAIMINRLNTN
ncbi:uncharacterized protein LOC106158696 [Lingula anatina]|uniref:Uncharacterized protein LOC106158696 n=1 Tax=Lingula anatina TaxID=7574 RepID=A0A1S3HYR5_LINAN|nr:uncharacterized protein LOC106158696 [Lingula anatina]|eukprot:XP_013390224.1 uncharacterized protein LOC106158696 [Lingula anatina]